MAPSSPRPLIENLLWLSTLGLGVYFFQLRRRQLLASVKNSGTKHAIPSSLSSAGLEKELQVAVDLALAAGRNMHAYCNEKGTAAEAKHDLGISEKGQAENFSTKIDIENETAVTKGLLEAFPAHKIIGEETVGTGEVPPLTDEPTWIIDPIDGTTNFAAGLPLTCVSIGFCQNGQPVLGVVYAPMTDELYVAVKGFGAFRNGVRITKRQSKKSVKDAIICFEAGYARSKEAADKELGALKRIMENGYRSLKSIGSGVLDLCYVATGRLDVVYAGLSEGSGWKPWDYCAGVVILEEAGCVIEMIDREDFNIYANSLICAVSKSLVRETRKLIKAK